MEWDMAETLATVADLEATVAAGAEPGEAAWEEWEAGEPEDGAAAGVEWEDLEAGELRFNLMTIKHIQVYVLFFHL